MNIIIVGAGKVGRTLCFELASAKHNITIIDQNEQLVDSLLNKVDINGYVGNGANVETLRDVQVENADIFIATTDSDELNIIACALAKKMGAKDTVSRVRNPEYSGQFDSMKSALGISMMINPELSAARDISRSIRYTSSSSVQTLAGNLVSLVEIEVTEDSPLANLSLPNFRVRYGTVLVCIINRGDDVIIPSGTDTLYPGDTIFVIGQPDDMAHFNRAIRNAEKLIRSVMIVGGGRITQYLVPLLAHNKIDVKVIENQKERAIALSESMPNAHIIHADGTDAEVLEEQGINHYDAFISLTNVDEENLLMSLFASKMGVEKVMTKLSRVNLLKVVDTSSLKRIVTPKNIAANEIARFVRARENAMGSNVESLYRLDEERVEVLVFKIAKNCAITEVPLAQLRLKNNLLIAYIVRNGKLIFPNGQDQLHIDDRVIVMTTHRNFSDISDIVGEE